jgi:dipeptidyl aminopeptidase/acylaminoacyl peptidase
MKRLALFFAFLLSLLSSFNSTAQAADLPGFRILDSRQLPEATEHHVSYQSGNLTVRAFIYLADSPEPRPLVVFNHGGINGVSADMKRRSLDLVRAGYTVITPTYRGEGGSQGRVEVAAGEIDDVLVATRLMRNCSQVNSERVGIIGSSHGALISVMAAARQPLLYQCLGASCGVMDQTEWYHWLVANDFDVSDSLTVAIYGTGPQDKPQAFSKRRAVLQAHNLLDPVLLQYGLSDPIVPVDQGLRMQQAILEGGKAPLVFMTYPLLGHAFWFWNDTTRHSLEDINQADSSWGDLLQFLETHLSP